MATKQHFQFLLLAAAAMLLLLLPSGSTATAVEYCSKRASGCPRPVSSLFLRGCAGELVLMTISCVF